MKYAIKPKYAGAIHWFHLFLDPFLAMLFMGILGHHLAQYHAFSELLFHFGYWNTFLAVLIIQIIAPETQGYYNVEEEK